MLQGNLDSIVESYRNNICLLIINRDNHIIRKIILQKRKKYFQCDNKRAECDTLVLLCHFSDNTRRGLSGL